MSFPRPLFDAKAHSGPSNTVPARLRPPRSRDDVSPESALTIASRIVGQSEAQHSLKSLRIDWLLASAVPTRKVVGIPRVTNWSIGSTSFRIEDFTNLAHDLFSCIWLLKKRQSRFQDSTRDVRHGTFRIARNVKNLHFRTRFLQHGG